MCLLEAEVEIEVVEPWDVGADAFAFEFLGQVLVVVTQEFSVGCVVEGNEDGVVGDADVAVESAEEGVGEVGGVPAFEGFSDAVSQLVDGGLGQKRHGGLSVADMEIEGAGAFPSASLVGVEEFFDVPAVGIVARKRLHVVEGGGGEKGFEMAFVLGFATAPDNLAQSQVGLVCESVGSLCGSPTGPVFGEGFGGGTWRRCCWRDAVSRIGVRSWKGVWRTT